MERGSLGPKFKDRITPVQRHVDVFYERFGLEQAPMTAQLFGQAGREHNRLFGSTPRHYARIALKNHRNALNNANAQPQSLTLTSEDDILTAEPLYDQLTRPQCCPTSNGAAAVILASEQFVRRHRLESQAVQVLAMQMRSDQPDTFAADVSMRRLVGFDMSRAAANAAYEESGLTPSAVDVIELHDCFAPNELITYEALGLADEGKGHELVDRGDNTYGGKWVVNPSGGLLGKGHPLGATGVAQCVELSWQLRQRAGARQVTGAKVALQHNIGKHELIRVTMSKASSSVILGCFILWYRTRWRCYGGDLQAWLSRTERTGETGSETVNST
jgi:acetyl-CoA acetyltransferase